MYLQSFTHNFLENLQNFFSIWTNKLISYKISVAYKAYMHLITFKVSCATFISSEILACGYTLLQIALICCNYGPIIHQSSYYIGGL